jgi:hypothetical protein
MALTRLKMYEKRRIFMQDSIFRRLGGFCISFFSDLLQIRSKSDMA